MAKQVVWSTVPIVIVPKNDCRLKSQNLSHMKWDKAILWTEFVVDDPRSIHSFISKDPKKYADRFIDKLIARTDQLEKNPNSGRVVPEFEGLL